VEAVALLVKEDVFVHEHSMPIISYKLQIY